MRYDTTTDDGHSAAPDGFRPHCLLQSVGLIDRHGDLHAHDPRDPNCDDAEQQTSDRACTDTEVLHYMLEAEATRQDLERSTSDLRCLMEQSAKAAREAQNAVRSKSDFLAMISHEIRTPLNGILGMSSVLLSRDLPAHERDCIETIRSSGEALLAVLDHLLDFSKIEAGRLELECADFHPAQAIHEALQIIKATAGSKALSLHAEIDASLPRLVGGDALRLRQVLLNLLGNAVKFTEAGIITLNARLVSESQTGYELRFSVVDQGIGIPKEQQQKLFQPFTQANASTSRKYGGTGLGLAICKQIVELMGGQIGVESRPGEGSTFWFTVRALRPQSALPLAHITAPQADSTSAGHTSSDLRILLVEDNPINQKVALMMLKNLGYTADVAQDGRDAIKRHQLEHYDLILMDCLMPEMDGFEATRRIRATSGHGAQVPIIAMTARAYSKDRDDCLSAGMTDYLAKPVREPELKDKLKQWLSGTGGHFRVPHMAAAE